jgi:hypothetical protein
MTRAEIDAAIPDSLHQEDTPLERARHAMQHTECWSPGQQMGSRWPIGCVALEITQRCNLDCTLCYLSEHSEEVRDIPLEEVFRRIDLIHRHYGPNTDVQVTGGDPTLRQRDELLAIVTRIRELGMRPTLMTNGRKATRSLLEALATAGLVDVAFHVDTTQQIKGYRSEVELNEVRAAYIERCNGLPLSVMFNTTVHEGNFEEIPELVRFFRSQAGRVRTVSFQPQAQTGRGVHEKKVEITLDAVAAEIEKGAGTTINFASSLVGHPGCTRYSLCFAAGGRLYDALDDTEFIAGLQPATAHLVLDRSARRKAAKRFLAWLAANPRHWASVLRWVGVKAWQMKAGLASGRGEVNTLSFLIHGFMDAGALERERIDACVFKAMTAEGPVSMCLHNAKRDGFILQPIRLHTSQDARLWQPLGEAPRRHGLKHAKGRTRQDLLKQRAR